MPRHKPIKFEATLEPTLKKEVERIIKENPKAKSLINITLALAAMGGVLTIGALAPNLLGTISRINKQRKKESYRKYQQIWRSFDSLKKQRALEFVREEDGYLIYKINKKGKEKIKKFVFEEMKIEEPKKWDKKWRLVIFDIPERFRKNRTALRNKLIDLGFYQCQKSAWIHPFDCSSEIEFIKDILNIKPFVRLFVVDEMDDGKVLYHFKDIIKKTI